MFSLVTPSPTATATATATPTPVPTVTETVQAVADTVSLNPDQFAAFAVMAALVIGLMTLVAVGVYRR